MTVPSESGDEAGPATKGGRSRRARLVVAGMVLFTGFAGVAIWQAVSSSAPTGSGVLVGARGQPAPPFSLPVLQDPQMRVSLASLRGKPLVVNFWASWCVPCRTEMPLLEAAFRAQHKNVEFLGIDANDTTGGATAFLSQVHVTYPTVADTNGATATKYGLYGLPVTIFISPTGKVLGRHIGQLGPSTLDAALHQAFRST